MFGILNPFILSGPQFLQFYGTCLGIVSAITIGWRILQWITRVQPASDKVKPLDVWDLAYLRGRDLAVAQAAVVDLSVTNLIEPNKDKTKLVATTMEPNQQLSPVPFVIFRAAQSAGGIPVAKLFKEVDFECDRIRDQLMDRGYVKTWNERFLEVWPGYLGFGFLIAGGIFKVGIGIYRDKPVAYLILLLGLAVMVGFALTCTSRLTQSGKRALKESIANLKRFQAGPARSTDINLRGEPVSALATWSFAVMGLATAQSLLDPSIAELIRERSMTQAQSGSGCSGSGCGGGGCGGGGCGGGCGGCGG